MELHLKDRLLIPQILPEKGNFMEFNLKKSILHKIAITDQDRKDYEINENAQEHRIEWNVMKDKKNPLAVDFSKEELEYMRKSCESIVDKQLPDDVWGVVEHIYDATQE